MHTWKPHSGRILGYTYENMQTDLAIFAKIFAEYVQVQSLGMSADFRDIVCLRIGKQNAQEKVFIFGGIHGREYMTSQLLMEQAVKFLLQLKNGGVYQGISYEKLMENRAVYVVPMANPDGVSISQFGLGGIRNLEIRKGLQEIADGERGSLSCKNYFRRWKANAKGVDLNRNFAAEWEKCETGKKTASSEGYKGKYPESERETQILVQLTRENSFCRTVSYHSSGKVIYWNFGQKGKLRTVTKDFARRISNATGYGLDGNFKMLAGAGYKDWALQSMGIPSLTIEIGKQESPLPLWCFKEIYQENRNVWEEVLLDLIESEFT